MVTLLFIMILGAACFCFGGMLGMKWGYEKALEDFKKLKNKRVDL